MKVIFSLIFFSLFLLSETLNEQIHALEDATPQERVALMNHIKEQLISMNEEKRMQTLGALRAKLQAKNEENHLEAHEMNCESHSKDDKNHQESSHSEMHGEMMQGMMQAHGDNFGQMNEQQRYHQRMMEQEGNNQEMMEQQGDNQGAREQQGGNQEQNNNSRMPR